MFVISKRPTISEIHKLYQEKKATPTEVVKFFLNRSKEVDKKVKAILRYTEEFAIKKAGECDKILEDFWNKKLEGVLEFIDLIEKYPLLGIPYNLKDNILVEGQIATSASKIMSGFVSPYSATVFKKLDENGGILISQSNLDEWAVGSSTENSAFGASRNAFDENRVPGGSSGGPASCIGSGQAVFSLGSDTGGSIRQPAAFNDAVGIKPTYGLISRYGVMPLSSSLDQVGPITNNVLDNLIITQILAGKDQEDQTTINSKGLKEQLKALAEIKKKTPKINQEKSPRPLKIGLPKEYFADGVEPEIIDAIRDLVIKLKEIGHEIIEVDLPLTKYGLAVYYTTMTVETAANLQRFDGVRYKAKIDYSEEELESNPELKNEFVKTKPFEETRDKGFGNEPKRRIMLGTFASSSIYNKNYKLAQKVKNLMKKDFDNAFQKVDVLLTPTTPEFPFKFGEKTKDPIKMYLSDALLYGANLTKIPAISIPLGFLSKIEKIYKENNQKIDEVEKYFDEEAIKKLKSNQNTSELNQQDSIKKNDTNSIEDDSQDLKESKSPKTMKEKPEKIEIINEELLPAGVQIIAPEFKEQTIYWLASDIENIQKGD